MLSLSWHHSSAGIPLAQVLLVKDDEQFEVESILDHQALKALADVRREAIL